MREERKGNVAWRDGRRMAPAWVAPPLGPRRLAGVKEVLTSGLARPCYYASRPEARPDCESLAIVVYGPIALCRECDLRRSAVGKGMAPASLPDPTTLLEIVAARDTRCQADAELGEAVGRARRAGHPWSTIGALLGTSRQGAQQRFARAAATAGRGAS